MNARDPSRARFAQRGGAALVIVLMLMAIAALAVAYASRHALFEQRTAANQWRATLAFEAAEAGLGWTLAHLNGARTDAHCGAPDPLGAGFAERYLRADPLSGAWTATDVDGQPREGSHWPRCVRAAGADTAAWDCHCPTEEGANLIPDSNPTGPQPAFRVRLHAEPSAHPRVLRLESVGCSQALEDCLSLAPEASAPTGHAVAAVSTLVTLRSALAARPAAALTVRGRVDATDATLQVINTDAQTQGLTLHTGGPVVAGVLALTSRPGTPGPASLVAEDPALAALAPHAAADPGPSRFFSALLGSGRETFRQQPGLRVCAAPCDRAAIAALLALHPTRLIWVDGGLQLDGDLGTASHPVLLVVEGAVEIVADSTLTGLLVLTGSDAAAPGVASIGTTAGSRLRLHGALMADADLRVSAHSTIEVQHRAEVLHTLQQTAGSWVPLPGSWRDWTTP